MYALQQPVNQETLDMVLFQCPRQPGRLKISKHACALRYVQAQKIKCKTSGREFSLARKLGLEICRTCPEGRRYAEEVGRLTCKKAREK
jgi:ribosomal protein S14